MSRAIPLLPLWAIRGLLWGDLYPFTTFTGVFVVSVNNTEQFKALDRSQFGCIVSTSDSVHCILDGAAIPSLLTVTNVPSLITVRVDACRVTYNC
jgi:hypothetical protein